MITHKRLIIAVLIYTVASLVLLPVLARCEESPFLRVFSETSQPRGGAFLPAAHPGASAPLPRGLSLEIDETKAVAAKEDEQLPEMWLCVDPSGRCAPCNAAKKELEKHKAKLPFRVVVKTSVNIPIEVYPTFVWSKTASSPSDTPSGNKLLKLWWGVDATVKAFNDNRQPRQRRLTPAELKNIASTWSGNPVGVVGMTVRQHLMDTNHGFTSDQLVGLTNDEMLAIHSAHHAGDITPFAVPTGIVSEAQGSVGAAGVIRGGRLVCLALDWWATHIGEGVRVSGSWSRNGGQMLPLARLGRWKGQEIYGTHGEFEINADGSKLPVKTAVMGYKLVGDRIRLTASTELDAGILGIDTDPQTVASSQPVGVSPMLILSVLSTVWQLLHPQADLQLPGHITCDAVMTDGVVTVTFGSRPSVRIVMLFTFQLGVQSVVISRESVVIKFSGSRWVRERTFEVKE